MKWEASFNNRLHTALGRVADYVVEDWGGETPKGQKKPVWFLASASDIETGSVYFFKTQATSVEAAKRLCEVFDEVAVFPMGAPYVPDGGTWK